MNITSAQLTDSITGPHPLMYDKSLQIILIGRSNVGKSSLINAMVGRNIASTSGTPGKTKRLYFYHINQAFYLVDLPGYGFAKLGGTKKDEISQMLSWFIDHQEYGVRRYLLVIDAKVGPTTDDKNVLKILRQTQKGILVVANKTDQVKKSELIGKKRQISQELDTDNIIWISAKGKQGVGQIWEKIV